MSSLLNFRTSAGSEPFRMEGLAQFNKEPLCQSLSCNHLVKKSDCCLGRGVNPIMDPYSWQYTLMKGLLCKIDSNGKPSFSCSFLLLLLKIIMWDRFPYRKPPFISSSLLESRQLAHKS